MYGYYKGVFVLIVQIFVIPIIATVTWYHSALISLSGNNCHKSTVGAVSGLACESIVIRFIRASRGL